MKAAAARIVLNVPEIVALVRHKPIRLKVGNQPLEIVLERGISPDLVMRLMNDLAGSGSTDTKRPLDPPEAREFLPRRHEKLPKRGE